MLFTTKLWFYLEDENDTFISVSIKSVSNHLLCCIQNNDINTSTVISNSPACKKFTYFDPVSDKHSIWNLHSLLVSGFNARKPMLCQFFLSVATDTQNCYYGKIPHHQLAGSHFYSAVFHTSNGQVCLKKGRS